MSSKPTLEELTQRLQQEHGFSDASIALLVDKGFGQDDFDRLYQAMELPDNTFRERRNVSWIENMLDRGDSQEITTGRYERSVKGFRDISSEQALVQGRMKFAVEYVISLADVVSQECPDSQLVERAFTEEEKNMLRSIYEKFRTKDYIAVKLIEEKTNHDIVAANTWVTIRGQQLGLDDDLLRRATHFARTSEDVNTNVTGELYMQAIGKWTASVATLLTELEKRATLYAELSCIARTHGQDAQLTTVGHIYANLAEQIRQHAEPLLREDMLRLDGKIAGAIGTDVDMKAAFPNTDFTPMYKDLVERVFGLKFVELGNDQDTSNAAFAIAFDTMANVGLVILKVAADTWLYASRGILAKQTKKGESGSSAMPQKANPFLAEGSEALVEILTGMITPIKKMLIAYREQGSLQRSITKREAFHPIMLAIIANERLTSEIKNYIPNIAAIEAGVYESGPKVISSAISTYLREQGMADAYDRIKDVVMKPSVKPGEISEFISGMVSRGVIGEGAARKTEQCLLSVMDTRGNIEGLYAADPQEQQLFLDRLVEANHNPNRKELLGNAIANTHRMVKRAEETRSLLLRYAGK